MTYEQEFRDWSAAHPRRDNGTTWAGYCAAQTYQFSAFGRGPVYASATLAYEAARDAGLIISTDPKAAPICVNHYWTGGNNNYGHVAQDTRGAATWLSMASSHITEATGDGLGFASFDDYTRRTSGVGLVYRGWSFSYGLNLDIRQNPDAGDNANEREDDMPYILSSGAGQTFITGSVAVNFPGPDDVSATKNVEVVETSIDMHNRILATLNAAHGL